MLDTNDVIKLPRKDKRKMEKTCTLRELIEPKLAYSYCGTAVERLSIADAFINACEEIVYVKKSRSTVANLSPDTVTVTFDTEVSPTVYRMNFETALSRKALKATRYDNLSFAPREIVQFCSKKRKRANLREVSQRYVNENKAYTLTVMLFYIIFGCHPFKGASYYSAAVADREYDLRYFSEPRKFVFDPTYYGEEKIEGYHNSPYDFWSKLSDDQRSFFTDGLLGEPRYLADVINDWKTYLAPRPVTLKALCGENVSACFYAKDYALISTDPAIRRNSAQCFNLRKDLHEKCKECPLSDKAFVTVTALDVKVTVTNAELGRSATESEERSFLLLTGDKLTGKDLDPENGGDETVFDVIPTKTVGVLGFKYLGRAPICIEDAGGNGKTVTADNPRFKVAVHDKIYVTDSVTLEITDCTSTMTRRAAAAPAPNTVTDTANNEGNDTEAANDDSADAKPDTNTNTDTDTGNGNVVNSDNGNDNDQLSGETK